MSALSCAPSHAPSPRPWSRPPRPPRPRPAPPPPLVPSPVPRPLLPHVHRWRCCPDKRCRSTFQRWSPLGSRRCSHTAPVRTCARSGSSFLLRPTHGRAVQRVSLCELRAQHGRGRCAAGGPTHRRGREGRLRYLSRVPPSCTCPERTPCTLPRPAWSCTSLIGCRHHRRRGGAGRRRGGGVSRLRR